eukprot:534577_1
MKHENVLKKKSKQIIDTLQAKNNINIFIDEIAKNQQIFEMYRIMLCNIENVFHLNDNVQYAIEMSSTRNYNKLCIYLIRKCTDSDRHVKWTKLQNTPACIGKKILPLGINNKMYILVDYNEKKK